MTTHFGEHITIDGYFGDPEKLNDESNVTSCINELCEVLEMTKLIDPVTIAAPDNGLKDPGGWSSFVIIAESHISIHTFPKRKFVSADVYTCKNNLPIDKVVKVFKRRFELQDTETHFILRGTNYPQSNLV